MPTVLRSGPYRVFFHSDEGHEPPHVHVVRDDRIAKFWLDPVKLARAAAAFRSGISPASEGSSWSTERSCRSPGMSGSEPRARNVSFVRDRLSVDLVDGRTILVPLSWYPRLLRASPDQRERWELIAAGHGICWPDLDEDLSTEGLLRGRRAAGRPEPTGTDS